MVIALDKAIEAGKARYADLFKVRVYHEDPELFFMLDFSNDAIFLDPLLFAYYHYKADAHEQHWIQAGSQIGLRQILWGYVPAASRTEAVPVFTDANGLLYLPNFGYAQTTLPNRGLVLRWEASSQEFALWDGEQPVAASWQPLEWISDTQIEVWQSNHLFLEDLFNTQEAPPDSVISGLPEVEVGAITALKVDDLRSAFAILRTHLPTYYAQVCAAGRSILLFHNEIVRPFVSLSTLGVSFISTRPADSVVFYITEIVHQFGHNILGWAMVEIEEYFRVNPSTLLREYNGNERDRRTVFSAFHGHYTTAVVAICLEALLQKGVFAEQLRHELVGRLSDNYRRFRTGLERTDLSTLLTEKGLSLYQQLDEACMQVYTRQQSLVSLYDVSNQGFIFSYPKFLQNNPLMDEGALS